jgi:hypothetical protein
MEESCNLIGKKKNKLFSLTLKAFEFLYTGTMHVTIPSAVPSIAVEI